MEMIVNGKVMSSKEVERLVKLGLAKESGEAPTQEHKPCKGRKRKRSKKRWWQKGKKHCRKQDVKVFIVDVNEFRRFIEGDLTPIDLAEKGEEVHIESKADVQAEPEQTEQPAES